MGRLARFAAGLAAAVAFAAAASAGTVFTDPYGVGAPDVLGPTADFDIRSLELTLSPSSLAIDLRMNYHGGDTTLAAFTESGASYGAVAVGIGDVLIQGQHSLWAIPLTPASGVGGIGGIYYVARGPIAVDAPATRGQVLPGSMYQVTGSLSAGQVLGVGPAGDLRADAAVWGDGGTIGVSSPDYAGNFPTVTALGGPELEIQLQISTDQAFYDDLAHGYRVHFASTTCACDVLDGAVPEPGLLSLVACGLVGVAFLRRV
jgi:hypothetical protein